MVGKIVDYSRDYTVVNGFLFEFAKLHIQSVKKCEMTSFSMTLLHVDLNEAAKCVEIILLTLLASLSRLRTFIQNTKWQDSSTNS